MKLPHRRQFLYLTAAALPAASCIARAQAYPARPIRLVIPFPPGGAYDAVGRPWADRVKSVLGTGRQCSLYRCPSGSAGPDGRGTNRLREGKSREAVLRALWDRFDPASGRRTLQIASGYP